ncbi:hypothetical protein C1I60_05240 [Paenibacillus terrae]|uniref:Uncharacterized protein n=1 Tax=Paenibacillus terrae TaxID=159743 RepID=A0A4U2Q164_9BACL|nr:hypothetical protein [Paenibacillus terrae]TKH45853.1 hypothetical protein C1I60_05240 [Paenibacillus terrae]
MGEGMTTSNRTKSETIQAIQEQIDEVQLLTQSENNTDEGKLEEWRISTSRVLQKAFSNASIAREFLLKTDANTFHDVGVSYLKGLIIDINKGLFEKIFPSSSSNPDLIDLQSFHVIIRRIMRNFYKHIEEMYHKPVHGSGTIRQENLTRISLGNEYDVQRMLFSLIRPIFPEARVEISDDGGYKSVRYDIYLREYETVIEVKCSRPKMSERELTEQLGSDAFHYREKYVYFFIYDKDKIVDNVDAFCKTYHKSLEIDGKQIETIIMQPVVM